MKRLDPDRERTSNEIFAEILQLERDKQELHRELDQLLKEELERLGLAEKKKRRKK